MNQKAGRGKLFAVLAVAAIFLIALGGTSYWLIRSYFAPPHQAVVLQSGAPSLPGLPAQVVVGTDLSAQVVDPNGQPVMGARVGTYNDGRQTQAIRTDSAGKFVLHNAHAPSTTLIVSARGFAPYAETIAVPAQSPVSVALKPGRTISGSVTDKRGAPIPDATVLLSQWRDMNNPGNLTVKTAADGTFVFPDLPPDAFELLARKPDYNNIAVAIQTDTTTADFKLQHSLALAGHVTDAVTHQPVAAFTIITGVRWSAIQPPNFQAYTAQHFTGGQYKEVLGGFGGDIDAWFMRIEADGYLPAVSEPLNDSGTQDFQLQPGVNLAGRVTSITGTPAAGAKVLIVGDNDNLFLDNETATDTRMKNTVTDTAGKFSFPPQVGRIMLVILADDGYAQAEKTVDGKDATPIEMQLTAWGHINGKLMIGSHPAVKELVAVNPANQNSQSNGPRVYHSISERTDADGNFVLDRVPPGDLTIFRRILENHPNMQMYHDTQTQAVSLAAGKTITVNLGGTGRAVTGRLVAYKGMPGFDSIPTDLKISGQSALLLPDMPDNVKKSAPAARQAWLNLYALTPAGKSHTAEIAKATARRTYSAMVGADGKFRVDDLPAGEYDLSFNAYPLDGGMNIARCDKSFTIPEMPGGRSDEPLDIGDVPLAAQR